MIPYNEFIEKRCSIRNRDHYLTRSSAVYDNYIEGLYSALTNLCTSIGVTATLKFINEKLQFQSQNFSEKQFIQSSCELSAMNYFSGRENINFIYENKVTPPKDVDFSITTDDVSYNVEVKCASYNSQVYQEEEQVSIKFTNRAPSNTIRERIFSDLSSRLSPHYSNIVEDKNMDNNLKDFLLSTQGKVLEASDNDINILLICCDDEIDMLNWRGYLYEEGGYLTESSRIDHSQFDKVDYILLTNLYNRHNKYYSDDLVTNHWDISHAFCLLYPNFFSRQNISQKDYNLVSNIFPNQTVKFEKYMKDKNDLPEGECYETKRYTLGISFFLKKYGKNITYFRKKLR